MPKNENDFVACVHCGVSTLRAKFKRVPTSANSALTIACERCFRTLPVEEVAAPKLPDYLAYATSQMSAYADSVRSMRGATSVAPSWFMEFNRGGVTKDLPCDGATETL